MLEVIVYNTAIAVLELYASSFSELHRFFYLRAWEERYTRISPAQPPCEENDIANREPLWDETARCVGDLRVNVEE
ncbi:hypothetical protein L6452_32076 [Arctium lappa]|uniref:Uncharacterized protein n=1 Tax=Arctium lappa TaxID=4217 RepID=A0ACB8Z3Y8_ARCLA|nr:hypothetical protein L6452_32076 [Arctium lappa]